MELEFIRSAAIKIPTTIFTGNHHGACFIALKKSVVQGFIADQYAGSRFVDRTEALEIAKEAGQKIIKHPPRNILLSEDLLEDNRFNC